MLIKVENNANLHKKKKKIKVENISSNDLLNLYTTLS